MVLALEFRKQLTRFLLLSLLILLILGGINLWLRYDINRYVAAIQNNKREIFAYAHATETLTSLKTDSVRAKSEKLFLEGILPQSEGLINFPRDLGVLAKQTNVEVSFQFGSEVKSSENIPGFINFNLSIAGSFNGWLRFLEIFERGRYFMAFDSFNITGDGKTHRLNINGKVFTQ